MIKNFQIKKYDDNSSLIFMTAPVSFWFDIMDYADHYLGASLIIDATNHFHETDFDMEESCFMTESLLSELIGSLNICVDMYNETGDIMYKNRMLSIVPISYLITDTIVITDDCLDALYEKMRDDGNRNSVIFREKIADYMVDMWTKRRILDKEFE